MKNLIRDGPVCVNHKSIAFWHTLSTISNAGAGANV
jgi:hypothetical protein